MTHEELRKKLGRRDYAIAQLMADGLTTKEIAARLPMRLEAFMMCMTSIQHKLDVKNNLQVRRLILDAK